MSDTLVVAIIAGGVSLGVSIIGFLSSMLMVQSSQRDLERRIQSQFTDKLYALRLEHYPMAFKITERIIRRARPEGIVSHDILTEAGKELWAWRTGIVSLIISNRSLKALYELRDALQMGAGDKSGYTDDQIEKIMRARNDFRGCLRSDLGFLFKDEFDRTKQAG